MRASVALFALLLCLACTLALAHETEPAVSLPATPEDTLAYFQSDEFAHRLARRGFDAQDFFSLFKGGLSVGCFFALLDPKIIGILISCDLFSLLSGISLVMSPSLSANYDAAKAFSNTLPGLCSGDCSGSIRSWGDTVEPRCGNEVIIDIGPVLDRHKSEIPPTLLQFLQPIGTQFTAKDLVDLVLGALGVGCVTSNNASSPFCIFDTISTIGPVLSGISNSSAEGALQSALGVLTNPGFLCTNCTHGTVVALENAANTSRVIGAYGQYVDLIVGFQNATCDPNGGPRPAAVTNSSIGGSNSSSSPSTSIPALPLEQGTCKPGLGGPECNICTASSACAAIDANRSVCSNRAVVVEGQSNSYCAIDEPMLGTLFPGGKMTVSLARNLVSGVAAGSVYYDSILNFQCKFAACNRTLGGGSDSWTCADAKCGCVKGTKMCGSPGTLVDLSGALQSVTGPFGLDCPFDSDGNGTTCTFKVEQLKGVLPNGLKLSGCVHGECVSKVEEAEIAVTKGQEKIAAVVGSTNTVAIGVGAGVFGALAIAMLALCGVAKARQVRNRKVVVGDIGNKGLDLEFANVGYAVAGQRRSFGRRAGKGQQNNKIVVDAVSGKCCAGKITAIMGPSGSGKSTLLDLLAGKQKNGKVSGTFALSSKLIPRTKLRKVVGFVDQEDHFLPYMTVRECVAFAARCRLPEGLAESDRESRVDAVLATLGLTHVADSRVGGSGVRGVSGGERRRVSIACELVAGCGILLLDEPTSGLDAHTAASLLRTLKELSQQGKTIILSIHQPNSDAFRLLDDLVLLSRGKMVYAGPAAGAKLYFAAKGYICPADYNVADYLLDLAVEHGSKLEAADAGKLDREATGSWATDDGSMAYLTKSSEEMETAGMEGDAPDFYSITGSLDSKAAGTAPPPPVSGLTKLSAVTARSLRTLFRDPSLLIAHVTIAIILGVLVGGLYFKSPSTIGGLQNKLGGVFFILALMGFSSLSALGVLSTERLLFVRERAGNYYGPFAFSASKLLFDLLPLRVLPALLVGSIAYWMIGLVPAAANFLKFLLVLVLFNSASSLLCMTVAAAISDAGTANLVCSITTLFAMLFGGFLINLSQIPAALGWIQYLSLFRYATEALAVNEASDSMINDSFDGIPITVPASTILTKLFGFDVGGYWTDVVVLVAWCVGLAGIFAGVVRWRLVERR